jgi:Domain of unknown function (DUF4134)
MKKHNKVIALLLFNYSVSAQISIRKPPNAGSSVTQNFGQPLANASQEVYTFAFTCIAILAVVAAFRIYNKWQSGDRDVIGLISRWIFGMFITFSLIIFLSEVLIDGWGKQNLTLP